MINKVVLIALLWLATAVTRAAMPVTLQLVSAGNKPLVTAWPVVPPLPTPQGLHPCCAFGYNLHAQILHMPMPFYELDDIVTIDSIGEHRYNGSLLLGLANLAGVGHESNGIVYTVRGGLIDAAHVRDAADTTAWLFSHPLSRFGQSFMLRLDDELAQRHVVFNAFTPPTESADRYALAVWIAAHLMSQLTAWHEITQWYGFESVPGFSEEVSAFSPEDLYSNLLGTRIAVSLILNGQLTATEMYDVAMNNALRQALMQLGAKPEKVTRFQFDMLNDRWWGSKRRIPERYLVLRRNYDVSDSRLPTPIPDEQASLLRLMLPHRWRERSPGALAQLEPRPDRTIERLPTPGSWYTAANFSALATVAQCHNSEVNSAP